MSTVVVLPRLAWEQFLQTRDEKALLAIIRSLPRRPPPKDVDYPEWHRICDLRLAGEPYRVTRLVDVEDGEVRLFIGLIDQADKSNEGCVPFWLQGAGLQQWILDETKKPTKGPIDWERYRTSD